MRVIRTCREMGIESVAVYSDADAHALHVTLADRAVRIGAAPAAESYLSIDRVIAAARETGADADPSRLRLPLGERAVCRRVRGCADGTSSARRRRRSR